MQKMRLTNKTKSLRIDEALFSLCLFFELSFYFVNADKYFQLSGYYYPLLFALIVGTFTLIRQRKINKIQKVIIVIFAILLVTISLNKFSFNTGYLYSYICLLALLYIFSNDSLNANVTFFAINSYILGALLMVLLIFIFRVRYYDDVADRLTINVFGRGKIDPNYLAAFFVGPTIICFDKFLKRNKFFNFLLFVLLFLGIFCTGSRAALIAIILGVALYIKDIILYFKKHGIIFFAALFAFIILVVVILKTNIFERYDIKSLFDGSNSRRLSLWINALKTIIKNPIIGNGIVSTSEIIGSVTGMYNPAHNTFLEVWIQLGIFGLISILYLTLKPLSSKNNLVKSLVLVNVFVSLMISAEATLAFWMNIAIANKIANKGDKDEWN